MTGTYRYAAFISYSSRDAAFAQRLHRALETYGIPTKLGRFDLLGGAGKPNRIYPVFRDREELSAGELAQAIVGALDSAAALIVVCSPNAAASPWVEKEIEHFLAAGRRDRIFAIIADDAPLRDDAGTDATALSFPPAFRGDGLVQNGFEPIAADARKGKDGFRNAWLKIVAGLVGVNAGALQDRDRKRRATRRTQLTAAAGIAILGGLLTWAGLDTYQWRSDLAGRARDLVSQGQILDATPWTLASLPSHGAINFITPPDAEDLRRRLPLVKVVADLGDTSNLIDRGFDDFFTFSADGARAFAIDTSNQPWLYDIIRSGRVALALPPSDGSATSAPGQGPLDSPDAFFVNGGRSLILRASHGKSWLYDLSVIAAPTPVRLYSPDPFDPTYVVSGPALQEAAPGAAKPVDVLIHDLRKDTPPKKLTLRDFPEHLATSDDGTRALVRSPDGSIRLYDIDANRQVAEYGVATFVVQDDRALVTKSDHTGIAIDFRKDGADHALGPIPEIADLLFDPDGPALALAGEDASITVISYKDRVVTATFKGGALYDSIFLGAGRYFLLRGDESKLIDLSTVSAVRQFPNVDTAGAEWLVASETSGPGDIYVYRADDLSSRIRIDGTISDARGADTPVLVLAVADKAGVSKVHAFTTAGGTISSRVVAPGVRLREAIGGGALLVLQADNTGTLFEAGSFTKLFDVGDFSQFLQSDDDDEGAFWFHNGFLIVAREPSDEEKTIPDEAWIFATKGGPLERVSIIGYNPDLLSGEDTRDVDHVAIIGGDRKSNLIVFDDFETPHVRNYGAFGERKDTKVIADGLVLIHFTSGRAIVVDLRVPPMDLQSGGAVSSVCTTSGDSILPFSTRLRAPAGAVASSDQRIVSALAGRPWHPCDWRGLADGVEGWKQFWRRFEIVQLGKKDREYACIDRRADGGAATPEERAIALRRCARMCDAESLKTDPETGNCKAPAVAPD